jgi:hypothetical protein
MLGTVALVVASFQMGDTLVTIMSGVHVLSDSQYERCSVG